MLKRTLIIASTLVPSALLAGYWGDLITSEGGAWDDDLCAIHLIHMPGGRFLVWGYGTANPAETDTWVWNSFTNTLSDPYTLEGANIFCCGVSQLADGKPIIAGGVVNEASGIKATYIFNPSTNVWSAANDLVEPRWYPTLAMRSDGVLTAISGWIEPPDPVQPPPADPPDPAQWSLSVELFNAGSWSNLSPSFDPISIGIGQSFTPHFYPFMIPYHDPNEANVPKLFFAGRATASDYGTIRSSLNTYSLSFTSGTAAIWKALGGDSTFQGSGAIIMINGTDPLDVGTVFKFGGEQGNNPVALGRKINLGLGALAEWVPTASMNVARAECNIVALPDGRIAAVGGANAAGPHNMYSAAIYSLEIYDPAEDEWTEVSPSMDATRMYHSVATLTPNATIFTAGGEYVLTHGGNPTREANAQEYFPSYFEIPGARRPVFIDAPQIAYWDTTLTVRVSGSVDYFSLVKLSSTTHANDTTQRFIKMTPAQASSGQYHYLKMPKNGGIAPPGYYMLFAVYGGLPSVARYVQIAPDPD